MLLKFTPFRKTIDGVKDDDVAKDELGKEMEVLVDICLPTVEMTDGHIRIKYGRTNYWTRSFTYEANRCYHAEADLRFTGHLGAPGHGLSYDCVCGESLWKPCYGAEAIPFKDLDESDFIMSPEDVR